MKRTWIFFKLRMLQLKSDKTALFFSYIFPILLLLGIGYPLEMQGSQQADLYYIDAAGSKASGRFVDYLQQHPLIKLQRFDEDLEAAHVAIEKNDIADLLHIVAPRDQGVDAQPQYRLYNNTLKENRVQTEAILSVMEQYFNPADRVVVVDEVTSSRYTSYLVILLPGLIGMTLLLIGLNGFGGVLIEERHYGLFKNIKTIDASPVPFLGGMLLSRLLVSYSVAVALFAVSVLVFDVTLQVDYLLLALVVTLGCLAFLGIGLVIATISPSVTAFGGIVNFVQMPFIVLGGVFMSISAFPQWLQSVANAIPLTQLNAAMRKIIFESAGFENLSLISTELLVLTAWCVSTLAFARMKFKW